MLRLPQPRMSSRQGTLIFSTSSQLSENQKAVVCPMAWSSRKIPRVVTSTLSAEAMALSHTLDRLSFIRICWEWLKDPSIDCANPEAVLDNAPRCNAVTDCKSVLMWQPKMRHQHAANTEPCWNVC